MIHIILADDSKTVQKIINIVPLCNYKISNCNSYATSLLCKRNFDLIILDANLTGLNSPSELKGYVREQVTVLL